jgi:iron complex outermembrane receptor protein
MATAFAYLVFALSLGEVQPDATLVVTVRAEGAPRPGAIVRSGAAAPRTDADGRATLVQPPGAHDVIIESDGYLPVAAHAEVAAGATVEITVDLEPLEEEAFLTATRADTRLQDQPLRVEVIDREEIEEKALMTPGSVAMLLGETTGLRVQTTAPSLGAANVRIQGLRGHYSQLLADGLPLYGASALGGVINLVSRRPRDTACKPLVNVTTLGGGGRDRLPRDGTGVRLVLDAPRRVPRPGAAGSR